MHHMAHTLPGSQLSCIARLRTPPPTSPLCCTPQCVHRPPPESQPDSAHPLARHPPRPPPATSDRLTHAACLGRPPQPPGRQLLPLYCQHKSLCRPFSWYGWRQAWKEKSCKKVYFYLLYCAIVDANKLIPFISYFNGWCLNCYVSRAISLTT
jgi:hypothetical protein